MTLPGESRESHRSNRATRIGAHGKIASPSQFIRRQPSRAHWRVAFSPLGSDEASEP